MGRDGMSEVLAVIGGSGLYEVPGLEIIDRHLVDTPYGPPSDEVLRGRLEGHTILFLPRHGVGHRLAPHAINYRANICALKKLGATQLLSVSAVGSMRLEIRPGDLLVVDQFIDLTKRRASTFFDEGATAHVSFGDPVCTALAGAVAEAAAGVLSELPENERPTLHRRGTYVCIEGPQFSTRAESQLYRSWGVDVIGMTNLPEAKLAREACLPYATLALVTDYDCWHETEGPVEIQAILALLRTMVGHAKQTITRLAPRLPRASDSPAFGALDGAVMTAPEDMDPTVRASLTWLLGG